MSTLRVGLIGAGGRGRGAAKDCVGAAEGVEIVALGEIFQDRSDFALPILEESLGDKCKITDDKCFIGLDAYKQVIDSGVDMVILATPPGFRPAHIRYAAEKGKHIFAEKPVATDPAGVRSILESGKIIDEKKISLVVGTQRRHMPSYLETIRRIHDGAIGDVLGGECYWLQAGVRMFPREQGWSDLEWQIRNWWYFTWLSGDHIVEQHIHNIDVMNWAIGSHPEKAYGTGGRQVRTHPNYGHIYDHFAIEYTYPGGQRVVSMSRQIDGTDARIGEFVRGTRGTSEPNKGTINGATKWKWSGDKKDNDGMHNEHRDLIESIRSGKPINEARTIAETTLTAIMGRMSAYTGKEVTWEQAMNSKLSLHPEKLDFALSYPTPEVPMPGKTQLV
jgi:myo-inositol 2-dehydrogenase / D-chiro-inositol 1-dehydrogenase